MPRFSLFIACLCAIAAAAACERRAAPPTPAGEPKAPVTNRVDIPAPVRQNLGITFARVERRPVARTIRIPGSFELLPSARREYHAPLDGRVELLVQQFERVEPGKTLYRLDSPGWRDLQRQIADAEGVARRAAAEQESMAILEQAHARHLESVQKNVQLWTQRIGHLDQIREAGGGRGTDRAQAQSSLAQAQAELAEVMEKGAEHEARQVQLRAEVDAATAQLELLLASAASMLGVPVERLTSADGGAPPWRTIAAIEVRAAVPGSIESIGTTNGAWVDQRAPVLATVEPSLVRFRARGLQSDLGRLSDGLPARIVPPQGGSLGARDALRGVLAIGLTADPQERTVDLLVIPEGSAPWARAGVSGFLEIESEGTSPAELAVPAAAVIRDGLTSVIFRRDPKEPDKAIRLEADLGVSDGRWVVVRSGLREGDEVVTDGVYQLMIATSGSMPRGGHFHADGTYHEGED
jgi:multidrug efflux pump subunit AcrA (membrane-fusion protein)